MNYTTESKAIFLKGIDANKNLPETTKEELKAIIARQFSIMSSIIATTELLYLREKQHYAGKDKI